MTSSKLCFSCALPGSVAKDKDRLLQRPTPAHYVQAAIGGCLSACSLHTSQLVQQLQKGDCSIYEMEGPCFLQIAILSRTFPSCQSQPPQLASKASAMDLKADGSGYK